MKLSALFAKFLYQHKELKLPGIGIFSLDPSLPVPDIADKNFSDFLKHIRYRQVPVTAADDDFINFIRTETGKIRPLAESDLDSFLSDGKILLNIGKPFHFEGIGYLQKNKEGTYEFTAGEPMLQRLEIFSHESNDEASKNKPFFSEEYLQTNAFRKILIAVGSIAGIVIVIWLGYSLYSRNTNPSSPGSDTISIAPSDQSRANIILDSVQRIIDSTRDAQMLSGTYKFVIERTANKGRAYRRYNQIKESLTDVKLETKDSTLFSLYFILPATPADTTRIKDSLKNWYGRRQVWVE